jgi:hypothetical protein
LKLLPTFGISGAIGWHQKIFIGRKRVLWIS